MNRSVKKLLIVHSNNNNLMILVWQVTDVPPTFPPINFPSIQLFFFDLVMSFVVVTMYNHVAMYDSSSSNSYLYS